MKTINYGKHCIDNDDINAVIEVLKSDYLTGGTKVKEFEKALTEFTGYNYCTLVNSGSSALQVVCNFTFKAWKKEIIIPSITFVATANVVTNSGGIPVFADVEENSLLIDCDKIEELITDNTAAIIAVDYAGQQCDYIKLKEICKKYNLILISDATHSLGAVTSFEKNQIADFTCYSFHPVKHITTGEGGAILTNDFDDDEIFKHYINNGRNNCYCYISGYNYKMSDINASLGLSQLKKLIKFLKRRKEIAKKYDEELKVEYLKNIENRKHTYHLYTIFVDDREKFLQYMQDNNIFCNTHYLPVYRQPVYFNNYYYECSDYCEVTEKIYEKIVTIPIFFSLTDEEQDYIIEKINNSSIYMGLI